jgi:hypothetical protein
VGGLLDPDAWWDQVEGHLDDGDAARYLFTLAIVGGFGIAFASEVGIRVFNTDWHVVAGYNVQRDRDWIPFFSLWGVLTLMPIVQGLVGACLLPLYSRPRRWLGSIGVAIVGAVPVYMAGLTLVLLPGILLVSVAFLLSCAWWGDGCRRLLAVPASESADFVGASLLITSAILFLASGWLVW